MRKILFGLWLCTQCAYAVPVTVLVQDAKGAPVAGALVQVESFASPDRTAPPLSVTTQPDGTARFDLPPGQIYPQLLGGAVVYKTGLALGGAIINRRQNVVLLADSTSRSGRVKDAQGKPVAGAQVRLEFLSNRESPLDEGGYQVNLDDESGTPLGPVTERKTGADGGWEFANVPPDARVALKISAPGYADRSVDLIRGEMQAETVLNPEARMTGRVLDANGAPVAEVKIVTSSRDREDYKETETDAKGNFTVSGLEPNVFTLTADFGDRPWVAPPLQFASKAGDNTLPPIVAQSGVLIRGTVRETDGTPVQTGLRTTDDVCHAKTDAIGHYALRVLPGDVEVMLDQYDGLYVNGDDTKPLTVVAGSQSTCDFTLQPSPRVKGIIVDETGKPLQISLMLSHADGSNGPLSEVASDENGHFDQPVPLWGQVKIGGTNFLSSKYEVVGQDTIFLPMTGELKLVVRPVAKHVFATKAVDSTGAPLPGVKFIASEMVGNEGMELSVESDANGVIRTENLVKDCTLARPRATKEGYLVRGDIKILPAPDGYTCDTLVFDAKNGVVRGTAVNWDGHPEAKATIWAAGAQAVSDGQGAFILDKLPPGILTVLALSDAGDGFAMAQTPLSDTLRLSRVALAGPDHDLAQKIIEAARADAVPLKYPNPLLLPAGPESLANEIKSNPQNPSIVFYKLAISKSLTTEDALSAFWTLPDGGNRLFAAAQIVAWRPDWKDSPDAARFVAQLAKDVAAELAVPYDKAARDHVGGVLALSAAYEALGNSAQADRTFHDSVVWLWKAFPTSPSAEELGATSAAVFGPTPRLFDKLLNYFEPDSYWRDLSYGEFTVSLARAKGLDAAAPYLRTLLALPDSESIQMYGHPVHFSANDQCGPLLIPIIQDAGKTDPALALSLARSLPETPLDRMFDDKDMALAEAAFWQDPKSAEAIWREVLPKLSGDVAVIYAARIAATQPALGQALYELARASFEADSAIPDGRPRLGRLDPVRFAYYEAQFAPARSRYRLELYFLDDPLKQPGGSYWIQRAVVAMARTDPERALELALQVPNDASFSGIETRSLLAEYLWDQRDIFADDLP